MAQSLTKEQRKQMSFGSQAINERELMDVFRREQLFDQNITQMMGEAGYKMSSQEEKQVGSHLHDRSLLKDEEKRVRNKSAERIAQTSKRVQILGHIDTAKKQLKNYMDLFMKGSEFNTIVRNKLKEKNPNLAKLIDMGDRLDNTLEQLLKTSAMSEKTKISIYNKIQMTRQYVNGYTKELAKGIYMKDTFAEKLREQTQDEDLIKELIDMEEISKFEIDIESLFSEENGISEFGKLEQDIIQIQQEIEKTTDEANLPETKEEVKDNIREANKPGKKLFTMKEAFAYQEQKVEAEMNYYKEATEHLEENKKRLDKMKDPDNNAYMKQKTEMQEDVRKKAIDLISDIMKEKKYSNEEMDEKLEFILNQYNMTGVNYLISYLDTLYRDNEQLFNDAKYKEHKEEIDIAIQKYQIAFEAYDNSVKEYYALKKKISDAEKYGKNPPIHPAMKEYVIRQRAERMMIRQYRPETLRQVEDKVQQTKEGHIYNLREALTRDFQKDIQNDMKQYYERCAKTGAKPLSFQEIENISVEFLKMLINRSSFCMCVPTKVDQILTNTTGDGTISDGKMKNSVEVGNKSKEYNENRKAFTEAKYGSEFALNYGDFEKYGYMDDEAGILRNTSHAKAFGDVKYVLKKNRLKHRTTFVFGDSYNEQRSTQPSLVNKPSITSIPYQARSRFIQLALEYHESSAKEREEMEKRGDFDMEKILNKQDKNGGVILHEGEHLKFAYYELQYHGEVTVDDVEAVNYYLPKTLDKVNNVVDFLKEKRDSINAWKKKGVTVNLIMGHKKLDDKKLAKPMKRSKFDLSKIDIDTLIAQEEEISAQKKSSKSSFMKSREDDEANARVAGILAPYENNSSEWGYDEYKLG